MAQTMIRKTIRNGGLVECDYHKENILGGMFYRETRRMRAPAGSPWDRSYRERTTTGYGFNWRLPECVEYVGKLGAHYSAGMWFLALALV